MLLDREYHLSHISLFAYRSFRVVLLTWDVLSRVANCVVTGQPLQPVQDFENVKSMLIVLGLLLKGFEVAIIDV